MKRSNDALILQLLGWIAFKRRTYAQTMDAWRSTCPRLSIWEDALSAGLVQVPHGPTLKESVVSLTSRGKALIEASEMPQAHTNVSKVAVAWRKTVDD